MKLFFLSTLLTGALATPFLQSFLSREDSDSFDLSQYNYTKDYGLSETTISELFKLHKWLVSTPSVSYHEREIGLKIYHYLKSKGLTVELHTVQKDRYNIVAYKGSNNDTRVAITSHIDTVPPFFPYSVQENGSKIFGRGATDAKGSVAAQIIALLELIDDLEEGEVALLLDVGEESGGDGFKYFDAQLDYHWESVIFGEPTENKLGVGHKGVFHAQVEVNGKAAHSGYPELGIDANDILVEFLHNLKQKDLPDNHLLGKSSLNVGLLEGGVAGNVISGHSSASLAFRVSADLEEFPKILSGALEETSGGEHIKVQENVFGTNPTFFDYDVPGFDNIVLGYGTDAVSLRKRPVEHKYLYGPGSIHVAHGASEYVATDDLIEAVDGYKRLLKHALL